MASHDPYDLQSQEQQKEDRASRVRLNAQTDADDLKWLMSNKRGRRIVWRQLERAGVYRTPFNTNAMLMAHACGEKNDGLRMLAQLFEVCPERYAEMLTEHTSK